MKVLQRNSQERGGGLMEYMLLATLVAVVCIAGAMAIGGLNSGPLNSASDGMNEQAAGEEDQPAVDGNAPGDVGASSES